MTLIQLTKSSTPFFKINDIHKELMDIFWFLLLFISWRLWVLS